MQVRYLNNVLKKILIIRFGAIGDVVHTTNLYRAIKLQNPDIQIHYLTSSLIAPLLLYDNDIDKVIQIGNKLKIFSEEFINIKKQIQKEEYDVIFNLQPSLKSRLLCLFSGAKQVNYKKNFKFHAVKNFWITGLKIFPQLPELKDLKIKLSQSAISKAKERLKDFKHPIIVINAGGMFSKRQGRSYNIEKWSELGNKIVKIIDGTIVLIGGKEDKNFLLPLEKIPSSVNFIGELTLEDSCAVISQADLMVSGDSGPLHIATALGVNSIGLYGSMPVTRTGGYCCCANIVSQKECVPCNKRKCKYLKHTQEIYAPCMQEIEVHEILNKCLKLLNQVHQCQ